MEKKQFCPILMIGFEAPEKETDPDPRCCNSNCAWYNEDDDACYITSLHTSLNEFTEYTCATSMNAYGDF